MRKERIYTAATDSTVTLYWRRPWNFGTKDLFEIYCLTNEMSWQISKTHLTVQGLEAGTWYMFEVRWIRGEECMRKTPVRVCTGRKKSRLDVTEVPYLAKGDGKTDNTEAIQRAVNDCGPEEEVYIPQGIFLTGALELHGNMAVYLEEGAVLLGSDRESDSSEQCAVFACVFRTGDDAVAVKSGKNPEGNRIGRPCSSIDIFDCRVEKGHGIAIGSEISGGICGVRIWDCDLSASRYGIEIKGTKKRGGYVRNIDVQNCVTPGICVHSVTYNNDGKSADQPPEYSGLRFQNIDISENL